MNRYLFPSLLVAASLLLSACSTVVVEPAQGRQDYGAPVAPAAAVAHTPIPGGHYVVVKGDTMYSIAFRNGVDYRDLAKWNGIALPYTIWPGQQLRLSPPSGGAPAAQAATIARPAPPPVSAAPAASSAPVFENVQAPAQPPAASTQSGNHVAPVVVATAGAAAATAHASTAPATPVPNTAPATASTVVPVAGEPKPAAPPPPAPTPVLASGHSNSAGGVTWRWPADGQVIKRFTPGDAVPGVEIAGNAGDPVRAAADGVVVYSGNGLVGYGELVIIKHNDSLLSAYGHNSKRLVTEGQHVSAGQVIAQMGSSGASRVELGFQIRKDGNPVDPLSYLPAK
ncbi:peptidoglycan DD-metalloendopeptidase family protein [Rhodanobacter sp. DHB23]|uniref:peptidoglycan DD-metalloendopeptidase family protein n=1 Tax=Rhodanobacter sp. DHB23 TaxID=2775923 RepID=UPI001CE062D8|nr:peptidoglycan DD-metalloendopeptidase family protein [Rhodanobacter sp. DHB23]